MTKSTKGSSYLHRFGPFLKWHLNWHLIKAEVSELLTLVNLIDSVTLVRTNPSLSFSAPYFSFFFYKQENGYEGLQGKQSELWDIFKIQFNIPSVPSKYECITFSELNSLFYFLFVHCMIWQFFKSSYAIKYPEVTISSSKTPLLE